MNIFVKQLESRVSQTRYGNQDCDGMGTYSEEKMIAVSKRSWKLEFMVVGVLDVKRRDGMIWCNKTCWRFASNQRMLLTEINGEGEPMWLTLPEERERERESNIVNMVIYQWLAKIWWHNGVIMTRIKSKNDKRRVSTSWKLTCVSYLSSLVWEWINRSISLLTKRLEYGARLRLDSLGS